MKKKNVCVWMLCCTLLLTALTACNEERDNPEPTPIPPEEKPKENDPNSGTTGVLKWELKDSVLTISGTGAIPDYDGNNIRPWASVGDKISSVIIGEGITGIGSNSFIVCSNMTKITIAKTVKTINANALSFCGKLTSITIPEGVTDLGKNVFEGSGLISAELPNSLQSIGESAFESCRNLTSIIINGDGLNIGTRAFYKCNNLTSVILSKGIKTIGEEAFYANGNLSSLTIAEGIERIGIRAFSHCTSLESIVLPESITEIEEKAFEYCDLKDVTMAGTEAIIGKQAFLYCEKLTSVTLYEGIKTIGEKAFSNCKSLESIVFPKSLTVIGESAFEFCAFKELTIPGTEAIIGNRAFYYCNQLARLTISEGIIAIEESAFWACPLIWVSFPKSLKKIGERAIEVRIAAEIYFSWEDLSDVDIQGLSTQWASYGLNVKVYIPAGTKISYLDFLANYGLLYLYATIKDGQEDKPDQLIHLGANLYLASKGADPDAVMLKVKISSQQKSQLLSSSGFLNVVKSIVNDVYVRFNDDFDFIYVIMGDDGSKNNLGFFGINLTVSNNIQGIGRTNYAYNNEWGSAGKLQSVVYNPNGNIMLLFHEMAHQWANFIVPTYDFPNTYASPHWGITHLVNSVNSSILGGYPYVRKVGTFNGKTKYQGANSLTTDADGSFTSGHAYVVGAQNGEYSDIDLYLMGLKSAQELRENDFRMDVYSDISYDANDVSKGYFYAGKVTSYTIDDIIRNHGPRIPDASRSQKHFKVLALLLTTDIESNSDEWQLELKLMEQKKNYYNYHLHSFYVATDGRGTLEVQGLNKSLKPQFRSLYEGM